MSRAIQIIAAYQLNPDTFPGVQMTICQTTDEILAMTPELILIDVEEADGRAICTQMREKGMTVWGLCQKLIGTQLIAHCLSNNAANRYVHPNNVAITLDSLTNEHGKAENDEDASKRQRELDIREASLIEREKEIEETEKTLRDLMAVNQAKAENTDSGLQKEIDSIRKEKEKIEATLSDLQSKNETLNVSIDQKNTKVSSLEDSLKSTEAQLESLAAEKSDLSHENKQLLQKLNLLNNQFEANASAEESEIIRLKSALQEAESNVERAEESKSKAEEKWATLKEAKDILDNELHAIKSEREELQLKTDSLIRESAEKEERLHEIEEDISALQKKLQENKKDHEASIAKLNGELKAIQTEAEELMKAFDEIDEERDALAEKCNELKDALKESIQENSELIEQEAKRQSELAELQSKFKMEREERDKLIGEQEQLTIELTQANETVSRLEEVESLNQTLQMTIDEANAAKVKAEEKHEDERLAWEASSTERMAEIERSHLDAFSQLKAEADKQNADHQQELAQIQDELTATKDHSAQLQDELTTAKETADQMVAEHRLELKQIQQDLSMAETAKSNAVEALSTKEQELQETIALQRDNERNTAILKAEIDELAQAKEDLIRVSDATKSQLSISQERISRLKLSETAHLETISKLEEQHETLVLDLQRIESEINEIKALNNALTNEKNALIQDHVNLAAKCDELNESKQQLGTLNASLKAEISTLNHRLESVSADQKEKIRSLEENISTIEDQNRSLRSDLEESRHSIQAAATEKDTLDLKLNQSLQRIAEECQKNEEFLDNIESQKQIIQDMTSAGIVLETKIAQQKEQLSMLVVEKDAWLLKEKHLNDRLSLANNRIEMFDSQFEENDAAHGQLQSKIDEMLEEREKLQQTLTQALQEKSKLETDHEQLQTATDTLNNQLISITSALKVAEDKANDNTKTVRLTEERDHYKDLYTSQKNLADEQKSFIQKYKNQRDELHEKLNKQASEADSEKTSQAELSTYQQRIEELEVEAEKNVIALDKAKNQIESLEAESIEAMAPIYDEMKALKEENERLLNNPPSNDTKVIELENQLKDSQLALAKAKETVDPQVRQLQSQLVALQEELSKSKSNTQPIPKNDAAHQINPSELHRRLTRVTEKNQERWAKIEAALGKSGSRLISIQQRIHKLKEPLDGVLKVLRQAQMVGNQMLDSNRKLLKNNSNDNQ